MLWQIYQIPKLMQNTTKKTYSMEDSWLGGGDGVGLLSLTVAHDGIVRIGLFDFLLEAMTYFLSLT